MTTLRPDDIYTAEVKSFVDGAERTDYYCGADAEFVTGAASTPASTTFQRRLAPTAILLTRSAFADHATSGPASPATGKVLLSNWDYALDGLKRAQYDGRTLIMRRGQTSDANSYPAAFSTPLAGTMHPIEWTRDGVVETVALNVRDAQVYKAVPLQTEQYAGSGGLEGTADALKGKLKPFGAGRVYNIPAVLVDPQKLIFEVSSDAAVTTAVRVGGAPLQSDVSSLTSRTSGFSTSTANAIADDGEGIQIAVADSGKARKSTDGGVTWNSLTVGLGTANLLGIDVGILNGVKTWLIVGAGGVIARSTDDGANWSSPTLGFSGTNANCVRIANDVAIIGGDSGKLGRSTDGTAWTLPTSHMSGGANIYAVARGRRWLIAGNAFVMCTSDDEGANWTSQGSPDAAGHTARVIVPGPDGFVVAGASGVIFQSVSGLNGTWTQRAGEGGPTTIFGGTGSPTIYGGCYHNSAYVLATSGGLVASSPHGVTWNQQYFDNTKSFRAIAGDPVAMLVGTSGLLLTAAGTFVYASLSDLQDDTLKPKPGTYASISSGSGSYFRLGFLPDGEIVTADIETGASDADRTIAQLYNLVMTRAGKTPKASDVTAADALNSAVGGFWVGPDDGNVTCGEIGDSLAASFGAAQFCDAAGDLRFVRLDAPSTNTITQPDTLATAPWANVGGTISATNGAVRLMGRNFSRLSGANTGNWAYPFTAADTTYRYHQFIVADGSAGTFALILRDVTAGVNLAQVLITIDAAGRATAAAPTAGSLVGLVKMRGPANAYSVGIEGTGFTVGHSCYAYACALDSGSTLTSVLVSGARLLAGAPTATIDFTQAAEGEDAGTNLAPIASAEPNEGIPPYQLTLRYMRNYRPLSSGEMHGSVSDAGRSALAAQWREATNSDSAVLTAHPLSQPEVIETNFADEADAQTETDRRLTLRGADHGFFGAERELVTEVADLELMNTIDAISDRWDLGAGARMVILGLEPQAKENAISTLTLTLWR